MGKKGTKRKTRWRALSIGEVPSEEEHAGQSNGPSKNFHYQSFHNGQGHHQSRNSRLFSSHSTPTRRHAPRSHSSASADAQPKITFNEDEYTRITTPRQDVLFKKGYLSRRKPQPGASLSTEPTTSNSTSTNSTQSASPEHLPNPESGEGDKNGLDDSYIYLNGFDPNIVYFANGPYPHFDGYGSVMMMPYGGYAPYSSHIEYYPPPGICYQHVPSPYQKRYSVDSQQTNTPETSSPHNEVAQNSQDDSGKQSSKENGIDSEGAQQSGDSSCGMVLNHVTEPPDHHIFIQNSGHYMYPGYVFGPHMYNMNGMNIQCANGLSMSAMDPDGKQKYKKKRRRKLRKSAATSGAAATVDCSEDEYSSDSDAVSSISLRASSGSSLLSGPPETDILHKEHEDDGIPVLNSVLNTNCTEFIPKPKVYLNANVNEFVPKGFSDDSKNAFEKQIEKFLLPNSDENNTKDVKESLETELLENTEKKNLSLKIQCGKSAISPDELIILTDTSYRDKLPSQVTHPVITAQPIENEWRTVTKSRSKGKRGKTELSQILPPTPESSTHELSCSETELTPDESLSSPISNCTDIVETLKGSESSCEISTKSEDTCTLETSAYVLKKVPPKTKSKSKNRKKQKGKKSTSNISNTSNTSNIVNDINDDTTPSVTYNTDAEMSLIKLGDLSPATDTIMEILPDLPDDNKNYSEICDISFSLDPVSSNDMDNLEESITDDILQSDKVNIIETVTISPVMETDTSQNTFNSVNDINDNDNDECIAEDHLVIELNISQSPALNVLDTDADAELEETSTYLSASTNPYPMTQAVTEWLITKQKEKSPEPILRIPDDSELRERISSAGLNIGISKAGEDEESDWSSYAEESENDAEEDKTLNDSKNLKSNPLRVSSVKNNIKMNEKATNTSSDLNCDIAMKYNVIDTDSDYLSDIQDDRRKRVAKTTSDSDLEYNEKMKENDDLVDKNHGISQERDLLERWEPEISSPKIVTTDSLLNHTRLRKSHIIRSVSPALIDGALNINLLVEQGEDALESYESLYGKSVNYTNLSGSVGPRSRALPIPLKGDGAAPPCNGICCSIM